MKKSRLLGAVCACMLGLFASSVAWASPITITSSNNIAAYAYDAQTLANTISSDVIPTMDSLTITSGNSSNTTNVKYSGNTSSATLSVDFTHEVNNTVGVTVVSDYAKTTGNTTFEANIDTTYSLTGLYELGANGIKLFSDVFLVDQTDSVILFRDQTISHSTANARFVLGVIGDGDNTNITQGSLVGNLVAGHSYALYFETHVQTWDGFSVVNVAETATGYVNVNIGAVPIPAAAWLFGSGLLGLIGISRRKKAA